LPKKVLIITYYWPPSGGAGVQRWLKFSKYLPEFGWDPIIYTPENPYFGIKDESLLKDLPADIEVVKRKIFEPYRLYERLIGEKGGTVNQGFIDKEKYKTSIASRISLWIRGNLFIPDPRRFWIRPSVRYLRNYLKKHPVDAIITSGPPHSMHLIGRRIRKKMHIPWIADFRDPWTEIDFYHKLNITKLADRIHKSLEGKVLKEADMVLTVNWQMKDAFQNMGAKKLEVVTNGFDEDDFPAQQQKESPRFTVFHLGSMNSDRNINNFWKSLKELSERNAELNSKLRIVLIGKTDPSVIESIQKYELTGKLEHYDYMPHARALSMAGEASLFYLPLNQTHNVKGITPGKLYEYLALRKPILCIGHKDGDAAKILDKTGAGKNVQPGDEEGMKNFITAVFEGYYSVEDAGIEEFSRKELSKRLAGLLTDLQDSINRKY